MKKMKTIFTKKNILVIISQRYRTIGAFLMLSLAVFSCDDLLEEEVYDAFTGDGFFTSVESAELGLFGIYDILSDRMMYGQDYLLYFQQGSDHTRHWRTKRGNDDDKLCNYEILETNSKIGNVWKTLYNGVYRTNLVIDQVTLLRDGATNNNELASYNNILGDAHFLRGFLYFQLVRNWGDVPIKLSSEVTLQDLKSERDPQADVYSQIEKDILLAISLLPDAPNVKSNGRINKGAAQGIMARIYLHWAGFPVKDTSKFQEAAKLSLAVIQSGYHGLNFNINKLTIGNEPFLDYFPEVFHNLADAVYDSTESMWEIHFAMPAIDTGDGSVLSAWNGILSATSSTYRRGGPRWYSLPSFYDSFAVNDSLRRDWSIATFEIRSDDEFRLLPRDQSNAPKWGVGKYRRYLQPVTSSTNKNYESMNWPVLRYADVLLMYAESVNETTLNGGSLPAGASLAGAYDAVNQVRRRAMNKFSENADIDIAGSGGEEFREQIRDERGWELCFEKIRKPDLIRWGILGNKIAETDAAMTLLGYTSEDSYYQADTFQPKNVLLPIPFAAEISQNPDILNTDPTNNGYR